MTWGPDLDSRWIMNVSLSAPSSATALSPPDSFKSSVYKLSRWVCRGCIMYGKEFEEILNGSNKKGLSSIRVGVSRLVYKILIQTE